MLIVPFVLEVTFSGLFAGRGWANVQHLVWDASTGSRGAADLDAIALDMEGAYTNELHPVISDKVSLTNTKVADLDSSGGMVVNLAGASTGDLAGAASPPNVAVLATKIDAHTRSQRPGRMFIPGVTEAHTDATSPNILTSTGVTDWQTALSDFVTALSGSAGGDAYYPVVLHKSTAPSGYTPYAETGLEVNALLATQRRRLRG